MIIKVIPFDFVEMTPTCTHLLFRPETQVRVEAIGLPPQVVDKKFPTIRPDDLDRITVFTLTSYFTDKGCVSVKDVVSYRIV